MISQCTLEGVFNRDGCKCVLCGTSYSLERVSHHCFFKSEYFKRDRDSPWNLVTICMSCHRGIHFKADRDSQKKCKEIALSRYDGKYKDELIEIMRAKRFLART